MEKRAQQRIYQINPDAMLALHDRTNRSPSFGTSVSMHWKRCWRQKKRKIYWHRKEI